MNILGVFKTVIFSLQESSTGFFMKLCHICMSVTRNYCYMVYISINMLPQLHVSNI